MKVGLFDSGIGGLTVLTELLKRAPYNCYIYLADTGRAPYGTKSSKVLKKYTSEIISFLLGKNVDVIVSACNTIDSVAISFFQKLPVPYYSIIEAAVNGLKKSSRIAVLATDATVESDVYNRKLKGHYVLQKPAQPLVSIIENGGFLDNGIRELVKYYLGDIRKFEPDVLILGCTHFSYIKEVVREYLKGVEVIDPSEKLAKLVAKDLRRSEEGRCIEFYVTGDNLEFEEKLLSIVNLDVNYSINRVSVGELEGMVKEFEGNSGGVRIVGSR